MPVHKSIPLRVVKIGGSLLDWPDLRSNLVRWLERHREGATIFIVGGGLLVEALREWARRECLSQEMAHEIALELMDINSRVVADWFPSWQPCHSVDEAKRIPSGSAAVFFAGKWAANLSLFARDWSVTSDAISAELSRQLGADELILLKSILPAASDFASVVLPAFVDTGFEKHLPETVVLRFVNLRASEFPELIFRPPLPVKAHFHTDKVEN